MAQLQETAKGILSTNPHTLLHPQELIQNTSLTNSQFSSHFGSMQSLNVLPEELLEKIIQNIPHNSLPALGQCSRKFQRLIVPQLYRCVYFDGSNYTCPRSNRLGPLDAFCKWKGSLPVSKPAGALPPHEPSQILKLGPFLRTISRSQQLRYLVTVAAFGWFDTHGISTPEGMDLQRVTSILSYLLPSLQSVYLSAVIPPATIIPSELNLTSLAVFDNNFANQLFTSVSLYKLFCIKALNHLTIDGVKSWDAWSMPLWMFHATNSSSNLNSLFLLRIRADALEVLLRDVLSWPKALEKLHISIIPDPQQPFSIAHLINPLLNQRKSLKELQISTVSDPPCPDSGADGHFDPAESRHLTALKRLCIPLEHLMGTRSAMERYYGPDEWSDFSEMTINDTIPPGLEQLTIECPQEMQDERSMFTQHLSFWWENIWKHVAKYPNLKDTLIVLRDSDEA